MFLPLCSTIGGLWLIPEVRMNFDNIFKFKTEEDAKKEVVSLNLPMWGKEDAPPEKSHQEPVKPAEKTSPLTSAFERIDASRFKGMPKFKPFSERIPVDMYKKILNNPTFPQISKAFADKCAERIPADADTKDTLSWLFQMIRIFAPANPPDKILNDAKEAESAGELLRAQLKYMDLAVFALVDGDATGLSNLMSRLHEITKKHSEKKTANNTDGLFLKRYSIIANQPREIINIVNEFYPRYEEEIVRYIENSIK